MLSRNLALPCTRKTATHDERMTVRGRVLRESFSRLIRDILVGSPQSGGVREMTTYHALAGQSGLST